MSTKKRASLPSRITFKIFNFFARIWYRKTEIVGLESLQNNNTIIVANHAQLNGPIITQLFMPENCYIWANGQMFHMKEVPDYAMEDFFPFKSKATRPIFRLVSYILAPLMPCIMENARAIPVYRDARIASTFRTTMKMLKEGKNIIIFPECHKKYNNIVNEFQNNFIDVARIYYNRTGVKLNFVPMYIAPNMKKAYLGEKISFNPDDDPIEERQRITDYLSSEITKIAHNLPEHTVVPFDNISKKLYTSNKDFDLLPGEKQKSNKEQSVQ